MLDANIKEQLSSVFSQLDAEYTFRFRADKENESYKEAEEFLSDFASTSSKIKLEIENTNDKSLVFNLLKNGEETGISYRGIPNGHEFTSLILAVMNADGKGKNLPDEGIVARIKALKGEIRLETYVSLTCTNCPDVVQALQIISLMNPNISHQMIDGGLFEEEVEQKKLQGVPTVFANGEQIHVGRGSLADLLAKLEKNFGSEEQNISTETKKFDVVVLGGGPAGSSAAIYSARKGLKVAIVAGRIGGQVNDTVGIENLISVPYTTGAQLADALRTHAVKYDISIFEHRAIKGIEVSDNERVVVTEHGERFSAPAIIIATGASWRKLNVPGEADYLGKGVAFCPHCDGPFFKDKKVAVVGGGNSGIEAAIDLAGICSHVTVLEFADSLKADSVLVEKAKSISNVEIFTSSQTTEVVGNGEKLTGIKVKDRVSGNERLVELDGVFVQIGLAANSSPFSELFELTRTGEIVVDSHCRTSVKGIYAAGDVTNVPYKQIVISMGEGAKAALSAFEDRTRGTI